MLAQIKRQLKNSNEMLINTTEKIAKAQDAKIQFLKDRVCNITVSNSNIQSSIKDQSKLVKLMINKQRKMECVLEKLVNPIKKIEQNTFHHGIPFELTPLM